MTLMILLRKVVISRTAKRFPRSQTCSPGFALKYSSRLYQLYAKFSRMHRNTLYHHISFILLIFSRLSSPAIVIMGKGLLFFIYLDFDFPTLMYCSPCIPYGADLIVQQSRALYVLNHFLYSPNLNVSSGVTL